MIGQTLDPAAAGGQDATAVRAMPDSSEYFGYACVKDGHPLKLEPVGSAGRLVVLQVDGTARCRGGHVDVVLFQSLLIVCDPEAESVGLVGRYDGHRGVRLAPAALGLQQGVEDLLAGVGAAQDVVPGAHSAEELRVAVARVTMMRNVGKVDVDDVTGATRRRSCLLAGLRR